VVFYGAGRRNRRRQSGAEDRAGDVREAGTGDRKPEAANPLGAKPSDRSHEDLSDTRYKLTCPVLLVHVGTMGADVQPNWRERER
jgi:hypothetical protein